MAYTHIDCFSGPGGICTGLHAAQFETKVAIEYIKSCVDTYSANHPEVHVIWSDIREVKEEQILPYIPTEGVDLVTSGMPCETFSTAGNTSRSFYDDRQFLFREGIRIAQISKAKMILFENVPAITTKTVSKKSKKLVVDVLKKELQDAGYGNYMEVVLSANQFGVPQKRNRYFILATRYNDWKLSAPTPTTFQDVNVEEAFAGLRNVIANSGKEQSRYTGKESNYSLLMKDDTFWKRTTKEVGRVGRDVTFSHNAMDGLFWSAAVTLDGDFLNMPEFVHMVNGGGSYGKNGWHGMYAMSGVEDKNGRIYKVDDSMNLFIEHAIGAAKQFISDRRQLNGNWKADS